MRKLSRGECDCVAFCAPIWYNRGMIPSDPVILLSFINTKLRDEYDSLDALCEGLDCELEEVVEPLKALGYRYDAEQNRFI